VVHCCAGGTRWLLAQRQWHRVAVATVGRSETAAVRVHPAAAWQSIQLRLDSLHCGKQHQAAAVQLCTPGRCIVVTRCCFVAGFAGRVMDVVNGPNTWRPCSLCRSLLPPPGSLLFCCSIVCCCPCVDCRSCVSAGCLEQFGGCAACVWLHASCRKPSSHLRQRCRNLVRPSPAVSVCEGTYNSSDRKHCERLLGCCIASLCCALLWMLHAMRCGGLVPLVERAIFAMTAVWFDWCSTLALHFRSHGIQVGWCCAGRARRCCLRERRP
jgi:hypothetical protein